MLPDAPLLWQDPKASAWKSCRSSLQSINDRITDDVFSVLLYENSVKSRTSFGGTAPSEVRKQVRYWKKRLGKL